MTTPREAPPETPDAKTRLRIRTLNDTFRATFLGGRVLMTPGVQGLGEDALPRLIQEVQTFKDFTPDNDPHGERDFGSVEIDGQRVFWKIDYYDKTMEYGSEDPSDPAQTCRVLTIMLAEEY